MGMKFQKILTIFNERKTFFNNHPETYAFIRKNLGNRLPVGTKVTISIQLPDEEAKSVSFEAEEVDKKFLDSLSDVLSE